MLEYVVVNIVKQFDKLGSVEIYGDTMAAMEACRGVATAGSLPGELVVVSVLILGEEECGHVLVRVTPTCEPRDSVRGSEVHQDSHSGQAREHCDLKFGPQVGSKDQDRLRIQHRTRRRQEQGGGSKEDVEQPQIVGNIRGVDDVEASRCTEVGVFLLVKLQRASRPWRYLGYGVWLRSGTSVLAKVP
ncbi:hypothetical protein GSI_10218 [Ganoderma sinense ZZ0214-1]|uniref:Uncharacterized protein n=1 Tax=Ganoderma sinense ZZ0214-1 TaxID=1077348 RepID=A0A2G8RZX9_9APHY|nr:hypothetical protein GSI_10218 [Ganoderma sinense ZZ0214-1]